MAGMTLAEKIGQLFVVGFRGTALTPEIVDLIQHAHVGGIILFSRNIRDAQQVLELTQGLQAVARNAGQRSPLLIAVDQENGMVRRMGPGTTIFPGNMALGAGDSELAAFEIAEATGRELRALGINMNLAPVVDVNNNPANPVIGVRSFGEDPQQVARLGVATVKGYQASRVMTSLKHFPGHGDTNVDSHLALPTITSSLERLEAIELPPFRAGIEAGADSIMTAHVYFSALAQQQQLPATLSKEVIEGLLRQKLGFNGVVISDCMEMKAITRTVGTTRGSLMSLQAGIDLVLVSHGYREQRASIDAVTAAVHSGELSLERIEEAVERVTRMKERYLSWSTQPESSLPVWVGGEEHRQLRDRVYSLSTTQVRNDAGLLPLQLETTQRVLVLAPQKDALIIVEDRHHPDNVLAELIQHRHPHVDSLTFPLRPTEETYESVVRRSAEADLIIIATMNAHLYTQQATLMQRLLATGRPVIGIAVRDPYDLSAFPTLSTYLATYEYTEPALEAAVRVLFGENEPQGRLPVTIPGLEEPVAVE